MTIQCHDLSEVTIDNNQPILLIGNPNVGKSALFSQFTCRQVDISNYPGTTVEITQGQFQLNDKCLELIDTPGIHSLMPNSDDERVTRDMLLAISPWSVVQVADAKNLRRALLLTIQLAEYEIPFVLALNMDDEAQALGIQIDDVRLAQILGADVIPTVATQRQGLENLRNSLVRPRPVGYQIHYEGTIETAVKQITDLLPKSWQGQRAIALALLADDPYPASKACQSHPMSEAEWHKLSVQIDNVVEQTAAAYEEPLGYIITQQRLRCVDCLLAQVWKSSIERPSTLTEKLDCYIIHPV